MADPQLNVDERIIRFKTPPEMNMQLEEIYRTYQIPFRRMVAIGLELFIEKFSSDRAKSA